MEENLKKYLILGIVIIVIVAMVSITVVLISNQNNVNNQANAVSSSVNNASNTNTNTEQTSSSSSDDSNYISEDSARESAIKYMEDGYGYESVSTGSVYLTTTAEGNVKVYSVEVIVEDAGSGSLDQTVYVGAYDGNIYSAGGIEIYG